MRCAGLTELLAGRDGAALDVRPAPRRRARAIATLREEPSGTPPHERAIGTALQTLVGSLAASAPIVIVLDDADLDLTVRAYNCLKREGIHTVGELVGRSEADLLDIRNFGSKSIDEVKAKLVSMGMSLKDSPIGFDPTQHQNYDVTVDDEFVDSDQA